MHEKGKLKKLIKNACKDVAFNHLKNKIQRRNIEYKILEMQKYLESKELTTRQKKVIFQARTGMLPVGFNFGCVNCWLCELSGDKDRYFLECVVIKMCCPNIIENSSTVFDDIYSTDILKVSNVSKLLTSALIIRKILKTAKHVLFSSNITMEIF